MGKFKNNQSGFSGVEGVLIIVIVAVLGFVGWYVYRANQKTNDLNAVTQTTPVKSNPESLWKTFSEPKDTTTSFKYPNSWKLGDAIGADTGDGTKNVSVTSKNGTELDLTSAGAGIGGTCLTTEHTKVTYVKKITKAHNSYVLAWQLLDGTTSVSKGLDVLNTSAGSKNSFTTVGDHTGCATQSFRFASTKGNTAGYFFGLKNGSTLNPKDEVVAREILASLTLQ